MDRRDFMKVTGLSTLLLSANVWPDQKKEAGLSKQVEGIPVGDVDTQPEVIEKMVEELFGPGNDRPAPMPTIEHLPNADLRFGVFTDIHIGYPDERMHAFFLIYDKRVRQTMQQINAVNPEFAVHIGDNTWGWLFNTPAEKFKPMADHANEILAELKCPLHNAPGTHDFCNHALPREPNEQLNADFEAARKKFHQFFGQDYYSFREKDCYFIVINNALFNTGQKVSDDIVAWFKKKLAKSKDARRCFLFTHEALFWRAPDETADRRNVNTYLEPARSELLELVSRHKVDVIYSGHVHFEFANTYKNVYMHTLNSPSNNREFLFFSGTPTPFPVLAQVHDPYKFGYLLVRVQNGQIHESWVPTYWQMGEPPRHSDISYQGRLVGRPATEIEDSALGTVAAPPIPVSKTMPKTYWYRVETVWDMINDHWWRVPEKVGAKWQQVWPPPKNEEDWDHLERALTLGELRGVKLAVPMVSNPETIKTDWQKLSPYAEAIGGILLCNGHPNFMPTESNPQLTTWRMRGMPEEWAESCDTLHSLIPGGKKIVVGRIPLRRSLLVLHEETMPEDMQELISEAAVALEGKADGLAVWMKTQGPPEHFFKDIKTTSETLRKHGLELWLDAVGWEYVDEPLHSAYFLRLLAMCEALKVRLFWWNGPAERAGFLNGYFDPTPMFFAAQAWQSMVDGPAKPAEVKMGDTIQMQWKDGNGQDYRIWWQASDESREKSMRSPLKSNGKTLLADPLNARLLKPKSAQRVPVFNWPLIARMG